jgi:hypothetical protein
MYVCKLCGRTFETGGGLGGHMSISHPKNGIPHPGSAKLSKVWEGLSDEDHSMRVRTARDSRFKNLDDIELTPIQEQMILGSLLGDMCIWKQHKNKTGTSNPELRISHCSDQRDYVMWKYDMLKNISRKEPYEFIQKIGYGAGNGTCRFETKSLRCLNPIYDVVIGTDGAKHITQRWLNKITNPIALASWFMDDGSKGLWFAMGLTPKNESDIVVDWLHKVWDIDSKITYQTNNTTDNLYTILTIIKNNDSKIRFRELVRDYIIPTMQYKL